MRILEIILSLTALLPLARLLFAPEPRIFLRASSLSTALVLVLQIVLEGAHWQLLPLYLACLLSVFFGLRHRRLTPKTRAVVVVLSVALILTTVALSALMPMFRLPQPTGQFAIGTRILHLVDTNRKELAGPSPSGNRELIVQVWYPANAPDHGSIFSFRPRASYQRLKELTPIASYRSVLKTHSYLDAPLGPGKHPVILYNPGWQGERTESTFQTEELASHGFIVIAIDHTFYGGKVEFPDGRVADSSNAPVLGNFEHSTAAEQAALGAKFVHIEADDDIFVLNQFETMNQDQASPWFGQLNLSQVGAMGFSIGGAVAEQAAIQDTRIRAALDLDGWSFGDMQRVGLAKPCMIIYEDKSQTLPTPQQLTSGSIAERAYWHFSQDDYDHVLSSMRAHSGYVLFIANTQHVDFTDRSLFSPIRSWTGRGTLGPTQSHQIINAYTLAFFSRTLTGLNLPLPGQPELAPPLLDRKASPYSSVEMERFP